MGTLFAAARSFKTACTKSSRLSACRPLAHRICSVGGAQVLEDSSGNGGASVACYAAAGGMDATIMAPASTSPAKTLQATLTLSFCSNSHVTAFARRSQPCRFGAGSADSQ
eukprot:6206056-Pleurochrysis_carterae.AAC.2